MVKKDIRKSGNIAIGHLHFQVVSFLKEGCGTQASQACFMLIKIIGADNKISHAAI